MNSCECNSIHKIKFTNLKMVCTNCGLVFDFQHEKPWFFEQIKAKSLPPQDYPMIAKYEAEYKALLNILNKRNLYHTNRAKIEELFKILFGKKRKPVDNPLNEFLVGILTFQ